MKNVPFPIVICAVEFGASLMKNDKESFIMAPLEYTRLMNLLTKANGQNSGFSLVTYVSSNFSPARLFLL